MVERLPKSLGQLLVIKAANWVKSEKPLNLKVIPSQTLSLYQERRRDYPQGSRFNNFIKSKHPAPLREGDDIVQSLK